MSAQARGQKESMTIKLHHLQYLAAVADEAACVPRLTLRVSSTAVSRGLIDLENRPACRYSSAAPPACC